MVAHKLYNSFILICKCIQLSIHKLYPQFPEICVALLLPSKPLHEFPPSHALLVFLDFLDATSATAAVATAVAAAPVTGDTPFPLAMEAAPRRAGAGCAGETVGVTKAPLRYEAPKRPPRALNVTDLAIARLGALHRRSLRRFCCSSVLGAAAAASAISWKGL